MNSASNETLSLDSHVDALMTMTRPAYVEISEASRSDSVSSLIGKLSTPLIFATRRVRRMDPASRCVIFIDCGIFDTLINHCGGEGWPLLTPQRILLYLVREGEFLQLSGEAYVRNLSHAFNLPAGLSVTYACFRDLEAMISSWEFCAGFYLWDSSDA